MWFGEKINKFLDMMDLKNHTERLYSSLKGEERSKSNLSSNSYIQYMLNSYQE